ncbi:MAG: ArsA family ATPase, partial [Acidimicrobiia bacterium]
MSSGKVRPAGQSLDALVEGRHILVCCGSGGVGKTTAAAVLALEGARRGRDAVVVTIDPARRLASALGLDELSDVARQIPRELWDPLGRAPGSGSLSALMLDTKSTFDHLVGKYAQSPEQGEGILTNRFYRNVSGALSGTQEYMAME